MKKRGGKHFLHGNINEPENDEHNKSMQKLLCEGQLVKQALGNAIGRNGLIEGLIFHSNRGSQHASKEYQKMFTEYGIEGSMSNPGCSYDIASMELFCDIEKERIYRREYVTMEEVKADMFRYIELFYNRKSLHSVLRYMSPVECCLKCDGAKVA